jgi:hypothetical protein
MHAEVYQHTDEPDAVVSRTQRLKLVKTIFWFEAFDISNRREISGRHGVALARNYLYPSVVVLVAAAVVVVYPYC